MNELSKTQLKQQLDEANEEEKKKLQGQLHNVQKMESIGTLAGGIAHDLNNLLMGIQGRVSLMFDEIDPSDASYDHLMKIEDYVDSAADLTKQLLGFELKGKYQVESMDVNDLLTKTSEMFSKTKKEIKVYTKYQDDLWAIEANRDQIEQVLSKLYVNAWQAMPEGGFLYLETENMILDDNKMSSFTINPGRYVKISVTDTGVGMDKKTQQRVFEPFFSTREMGQRTGLGLAATYEIIKNHGGIINVYSEMGHGTTFNIYLPASDKQALDIKEGPYELSKGTENILIVDDEDVPRDVGKEILERLGYSVLTAESGNEAIEIYSALSGEIDMVILDMIMPDMDGEKTFEGLCGVDSDVRVLLSSGYTMNERIKRILDQGCKGFIQKPFNMTLLSQKIREILDRT